MKINFGSIARPDDDVDRGWAASGTQSYFPALSLAVKDATVFGRDMKRAGGTFYEDVRVTYALDQDATPANLDKMIDGIAREIRPRDTFILFAAAHGFSVSGRFYLIPQDYQGGADPKALARKAISQDKLQDWLANRIKAKKGNRAARYVPERRASCGTPSLAHEQFGH